MEQWGSAGCVAVSHFNTRAPGILLLVFGELGHFYFSICEEIGSVYGAGVR